MRAPIITLLAIPALIVACSSDDDSSGTGGGGGVGAFGASSGTGGFVTTGGSTATGGTGGSATGGTSSGGSGGLATGGSAGVGGQSGASGASGAGGSAGASGASGSGGSTGGAAGTGGVATGGAAGTGGAATGGTGGTGGVATGGTGGVATGGTGGVATGGTGGAATGGTGGTGGCPANPILINEFVPNPPSSDSGKEWVELHNSNPCAVPIAGWTLERATSTYSTMFTFPSGASIAALGYVVVGGKDVAFADFNKQTAMNMGNASGSSDAIRLLDAANAVVDTVVYGSPNSDAFKDDTAVVATSLAPTPTSSQTLARSPNGVDTDACGVDFTATFTPTPKAKN